jgi:hypothetical protein
MPSADTKPTTCTASTEQPISAAASRTLPNIGSTGSRASRAPTAAVSAPVASSAPSEKSSSKDLFRLFVFVRKGIKTRRRVI